MKNLQITLSRKTDADLISFFKQQNERVATLVITALYSYIKGEKFELELLPVVVTEQTKRMNICLSIRETKRKQEAKRAILNFVESIPTGLLSIYIKGILRYTYGAFIYQTEVTTFSTVKPDLQLATPNIFEPEYEESYDSEIEEPTESYSSDTDDIFDLLESLLDD